MAVFTHCSFHKPVSYSARQLISKPSRQLRRPNFIMSLSTSATRSSTSRPLAPPPSSWDSHMHIIDNNFPLATASNVQYKPHDAPLSAAIKNGERLSVPNLVFVQPSPYGVDNSCQLSGVEALGQQHARAVIGIDPENVTKRQLQDWHNAGVRGVRVNEKSVGGTSKGHEFVARLNKYVDLISQVNSWVLQIHIDLKVVPDIEPVVQYAKEKNVKFVIDHMARPPVIQKDMHSLVGWTDFVRMLEKYDNLFTKVSAPYRLVNVEDREFHTLEGVAKELFKIRGGDAVVFASDWPHTRFEKWDVSPWVQRCLEWCEGDEKLRAKLFRDNAKVLWDVQD